MGSLVEITISVKVMIGGVSLAHSFVEIFCKTVFLPLQIERDNNQVHLSLSLSAWKIVEMCSKC